MNKRRTVMVALLFAASSPLFAQQQPRVWRIGILSPRSKVFLDSDPFNGFIQGMRELGYVDGKNVQYEWRFADGKYDQLPALVRDLIQLNTNVLVPGGTPATRAAQQATQTIPIVMASTSNPVGTGLVNNLARPGGNITGVSTIASDLGPKHMELLATVLPRVARVAALINPGNPSHHVQLKNLRGAANTVKVRLLPIEAQNADQIAAAFPAMIQQHVDALIITVDSLFIQQQQQIAELARKVTLPAIFSSREFAEAGGLMSYGQNLAANYHRAAYYVDKILQGAKPADLPVEQPTKFELIVNLRTAKTIGLTVPQPFLMRADRVIE